MHDVLNHVSHGDVVLLDIDVVSIDVVYLFGIGFGFEWVGLDIPVVVAVVFLLLLGSPFSGGVRGTLVKVLLDVTRLAQLTMYLCAFSDPHYIFKVWI